MSDVLEREPIAAHEDLPTSFHILEDVDVAPSDDDGNLAKGIGIACILSSIIFFALFAGWFALKAALP
jgi:hypothetical protein